MKDVAKPKRSGTEKPVSLNPLDIGQALSGLLAVKPAARPAKAKRKKPAPPAKE